MKSPQPVSLSLIEVARWIDAELKLAGNAFQAQDLDGALDAFARALGLALQLGPAATERVLAAILHSAQELAQQQNADGLCALGPTLVEVVMQVRQAGALPPTSVMEAWATIAADLGALVGQVGLVLAIAPDHRQAVVHQAYARAALLDDATGSLFGLTSWIDQCGTSP